METIERALDRVVFGVVSACFAALVFAVLVKATLDLTGSGPTDLLALAYFAFACLVFVRLLRFFARTYRGSQPE
jgi:hypothetical protein